MKHALQVKYEDNVANALDDIKKNDTIICLNSGNEELIIAKDDIKFGFKIAVKKILKGENIIKYGYKIGVASHNIEIGSCVHIHNVEGSRGRGDKKEK